MCVFVPTCVGMSGSQRLTVECFLNHSSSFFICDLDILVGTVDSPALATSGGFHLYCHRHPDSAELAGMCGHALFLVRVVKDHGLEQCGALESPGWTGEGSVQYMSVCGRSQSCVTPEGSLASQDRTGHCAPSTVHLMLSSTDSARFPSKQTVSPSEGLSGHSQVGRAGFLSWALPGGGKGASPWVKAGLWQAWQIPDGLGLKFRVGQLRLQLHAQNCWAMRSLGPLELLLVSEQCSATEVIRVPCLNVPWAPQVFPHLGLAELSVY